MNRERALEIVNTNTSNKNLVKHMLAVEAQMRSLARKLGEDEDLWGLAGLLHDADYEMFKEDPKKHPSKIFEWLKEEKVDDRVAQAIKAHAYGWQDDAPEPASLMDWALYCSDDLSGLIIACALVKGGEISSVSVETILKKWKDKTFAAGADRKPSEMAEEKLNIKFEDYLFICLDAIKGIKEEIGLK